MGKKLNLAGIWGSMRPENEEILKDLHDLLEEAEKDTNKHKTYELLITIRGNVYSGNSLKISKQSESARNGNGSKK